MLVKHNLIPRPPTPRFYLAAMEKISEVTFGHGRPGYKISPNSCLQFALYIMEADKCTSIGPMSARYHPALVPTSARRRKTITFMFAQNAASAIGPMSARYHPALVPISARRRKQLLFYVGPRMLPPSDRCRHDVVTPKVMSCIKILIIACP